MKRLLSRISLLLLVLLLNAVVALAQEMKVKSFELLPGDITARAQPKLDVNGKNCAVVKVSLPLQGVIFDDGVIDVVYKTGEYWVYMGERSPRLQIKHDNYHPLYITFADYGIPKVESNGTYRLVVQLPQTATNQPVDAGGNFYAISVTPKNAVVSIDGKPLSVSSDGEYTAMLPYGEHRYHVETEGYVEQDGTFTISHNDTPPIIVKLQSAMASVSVTCPTPAVSLYVDKKLVGTGSWSGNLNEGMHLIEAKKDGYRSSQKTIQLAQQQKLNVTLDALTAIVGNLSVNYKPIGADVYLDGEKVGQSPKIINGVTVGSHKLEVRKSGYASETKNITIAENQTANVSGTLSSTTSTSSTSSGSTTTSSSASGDVLSFNVKGVVFEMVRVEGGTFTMGATSEQGSDAFDREKPTHPVTLSDYYIAKTEITQALWEAVMGSNPSDFKGENNPVESVSWNDCQEFIKNLNAITGKNFRLPTEAEWEYAARGGRKSRGYKYSGSDYLDVVAWYKHDSDEEPDPVNELINDLDVSNDLGDVSIYISRVGGFDTNNIVDEKTPHPVATKSPNELGIFDMSGNVWEWCSDWYGNYSSTSQTNPKGPASGSYRVYRGGSWFNYARLCRVAYRNNFTPDYRFCNLGARLVL